MDPDKVMLRVRLGEGDALHDSVGVDDSVSDSLRDALAVGVRLMVSDGETVTLAVHDADIDGDALRDAVMDLDRVAVVDGDADGDAVALADTATRLPYLHRTKTGLACCRVWATRAFSKTRSRSVACRFHSHDEAQGRHQCPARSDGRNKRWPDQVRLVWIRGAAPHRNACDGGVCLNGAHGEAVPVVAGFGDRHDGRAAGGW